MCDAAVLIGSKNADADGAGLLRDGGRVAPICIGVERQPKKAELAADMFADQRGVLPDASGEDETIETAEDGGIAGDGLRDAAAEDGDGLICCGGALVCRVGELA
ncbi:MAG: hypothetical protein QOK38_2722 [Acidobacteriaceae bacterium]|nr:hypothetical protein [Acidobacteriaceae bacterium]